MRVYTSPSCSGVPTDSVYFSSGSGQWFPSTSGAFYIKPFCSNISIVTGCSAVFVASTPPPPVTTTVTTAVGGGGSGCKQAGYTCTPLSPCCPGLQCIEDICRGTLTVTPTTTTTRTTTTSLTVIKSDCPFECCVGEDVYYDKPCSEGFECVANTCQEFTTTTSPINEESQFPWGFVLPIILIVILVPLFVFFFIFKKKQDEWKILYQKWRTRRTAYNERV